MLFAYFLGSFLCERAFGSDFKVLFIDMFQFSAKIIIGAVGVFECQQTNTVSFGWYKVKIEKEKKIETTFICLRIWFWMGLFLDGSFQQMLWVPLMIMIVA